MSKILGIINDINEVESHKTSHLKQQGAVCDPLVSRKTSHANEALFRATFDQAAVGIAITDLKGKFLESNKKCSEFLGYSAEELSSKTIMHITHPDDVSKTASLLKNLLEGTIQEYSVDKRYCKKDGDIVWSRTTATIIRDANGLPSCLVGIMEDISYRKNAEDALKKSELSLQQIQRDLRIHQVRLESIIQFSEDAIITKTLEGVIESWNPAAEQIFGYSSSEVVGKHIKIIIPTELHHEENIILSKISKGERVEHLETVRVAKDGRTLFISLTSSPIKDDDGKIIGATKIARDITERRKHQSEVEQNEVRYRVLVEEKSKLLELESQARFQVEEANRTKDQFLATLSHELRTPLNAILGWSQLAARKIDDTQRVQEGLDIIQRNARSQAQIIEDLLDINRIMSGTLRLELQLVNLRQVVDEAIETVVPSAQNKGIIIEKLYDLATSTIHGDPNRLKQIIWNLLTNAVKFISKDGSTKKISVLLASSGNHVNLEISDSGQGIAREFLPVIFDRFSQADTSSTRRFGGLGLGLSIVKHLVELHGGQIDARSDGPGKGASFKISLPLASTSRTEISSTNPAQLNMNAFYTQSLIGIAILIIEDEPDARSFLKNLLEERGVEVWAVASAKEALSILSIRSFDILISDIGMPDEDGYQLIRKIRQLPQENISKIPAIALTAFARSEDRILALEAGFQMHVAKPVESVELLAVISSLKRSSHRG